VSDGDQQSQGFFKRHRKAVFISVGLLVLFSVLVVAVAKNWIADLSFLFNPVVLGVISLGGFSLGMVYLYKKYGSSQDHDWPFMGTSPVDQLSTFEAKELAEWALFTQEEPPIVVGVYERKGIKKVRNGEGGS